MPNSGAKHVAIATPSVIDEAEAQSLETRRENIQFLSTYKTQDRYYRVRTNDAVFRIQ
jgi:hypothetical protein